MTTTIHREFSPPREHTPPVYEPDLLRTLQCLLAALADIDFAHECDLEAVRKSTTDEVLKRKILQKLDQQHQERRAPYVDRIAALQQRAGLRRTPPSAGGLAQRDAD
jgi:hypothetical protein